MSVDLQTDWEAFNAFVDSRRNRFRSGFSLEKAVTEFRSYQRELAVARANIHEAIASRERDTPAELDVEDLIQQVQDELPANGTRETNDSE